MLRLLRRFGRRFLRRDHPGRRPAGLSSATVHGLELRFSSDAAGVAAPFSGMVLGGEITACCVRAPPRAPAVGRLKGALRGAPWAEMPPGCSRYYER